MNDKIKPKEKIIDKEIKLLTDNPIDFIDKEDESLYYSLDGLKFNEYTAVFKNAIINTPTPFTIGVFGKWGKGKTSFLKMLKHKIQEENKSKYLTVWFNAWKYEKEKDPMIALLMVIHDTLENNKNILEKLNEGLEEAGGKIKNASIYLKHTILQLINYKTKIKILEQEFSNSFSLSKVFKNANKEIESNKEVNELDELINQSSYIKIFDNLKKFEQILISKKIHMVIFIDDLDRCMPDNAVELLENIKLVLDLKNVTYVLGVANEVIEGHLEHKYEKDFGLKKEHEHGKSYLEKIVQLPFYLPDFSLKLDNLIDSLFKKINQDNYLDNVKDVIKKISTHHKLTPRLLIRHLNQAKINAEIDELFNGVNKYDDKNEDIRKHSDFMFSMFTFVLFLKDLYQKEYSLLITYSEKSLASLVKNSGEIKKIKDNDQEFESLLSSSISAIWLTDKISREKTIEFVDTIENISEDDIQERLSELDINELKDAINSLEEKIKEKESFDKIMNVSKKSYKTFIEDLTNNNGNKLDFSKFLVTNIWFKEFINSNAYSNKELWSNDGWEFINSNKIKEPKYLNDERFNHDFKPVLGVSYYEAEAFCKWLSEESKGEDVEYEYSLPTSEQFKSLASNGNTSDYPWGKEFDSKKCNNNVKLKLGKTSIVGAFSKYDGDTQDGICDMSGNVWKWTNSDSKDFEGAKVLKGGSWDFNDEDYFSASYLISNIPDVRYLNVGFFLTRTKK